jgi:hypothetical protein
VTAPIVIEVTKVREEDRPKIILPICVPLSCTAQNADVDPINVPLQVRSENVPKEVVALIVNVNVSRT